jgi:hypothetical protein
MGGRTGFEEVIGAIIGFFVLVAIVSTLYPTLSGLMSFIFFLFILFIIIAIVFKAIELIKNIF